MWKSKICLFLLCASCGPSSLEDLRVEGEAEIRKLAQELRTIENKEDLQKASRRLKKRWNKIADLLVETRSFSSEEGEPSTASDELFLELARLYEMPGGRDLIEGSQMEAVHRLKR